MRMIDIIIKKRDGKELSAQEFDFIAQAAAKGTVPDYQLSSFLMACFLNPLSPMATLDVPMWICPGRSWTRWDLLKKYLA